MNMLRKYGVYALVAVIGFIVVSSIWKEKSKSTLPSKVGAISMKISVPMALPHIATVKSYIEAVGQSTPFNRVVIVTQVEGTLL